MAEQATVHTAAAEHAARRQAVPDEDGFFGRYGGQFLPPELEGPFAEITRVFLRCLRIETTAWRGSMPPAATSGRNGWYVMYGNGSTTVTLASPRASHFSSLRAV